jgi:chemotaxis protein CheC
MDSKYQLTASGLAVFEKMSHIGAKNASDALSQLIAREVEVKALAVRALPVEKLTDVIGHPNESVTTVVMDVTGQVAGNIMLIFSKQSAINVADLLAKRELGATDGLAQLDISAIKEAGNIITGAFLTAISNYIKINMLETVPEISTDMLKATMDFVLTKFAKEQETRAVAFEIEFEMGTSTLAAADRISAYFVLLLDLESATKLMDSLNKK